MLCTIRKYLKSHLNIYNFKLKAKTSCVKTNRQVKSTVHCDSRVSGTGELLCVSVLYLGREGLVTLFWPCDSRDSICCLDIEQKLRSEMADGEFRDMLLGLVSGLPYSRTTGWNPVPYPSIWWVNQYSVPRVWNLTNSKYVLIWLGPWPTESVLPHGWGWLSVMLPLRSSNQDTDRYDIDSPLK